MKKWKWVTLICVLLLVAAAGGYAWWHNSGRKETKDKLLSMAPRVTIAGMTIKSIDPHTIKLDYKLQLSNPLPVNLSADSLDYEIWIDSVMIVKDRYTKNIRIPKGDSGSINLPVEIQSAMMKKLIEKFDSRNTDSADYTVKANFKMQVPVAGERHFNLDVTKRLPAIRKITASIAKIDVDKLGFKGSTIEMSVMVENHNSFPIDISDGKYSVAIEKDLQVDGALQKNVHIPARGKQKVDVSMDIRTAKIPALGWKMLFHKSQTHYAVRFTGELRSDISLVDRTQLRMNAEGTLDDIKDLARAGK